MPFRTLLAAPLIAVMSAAAWRADTASQRLERLRGRSPRARARSLPVRRDDGPRRGPAPGQGRAHASAPSIASGSARTTLDARELAGIPLARAERLRERLTHQLLAHRSARMRSSGSTTRFTSITSSSRWTAGCQQPDQARRAATVPQRGRLPRMVHGDCGAIRNSSTASPASCATASRQASRFRASSSSAR